MPKLLQMSNPSLEFRKFFIDSPDAEENQDGQFPRFTWHLDDDDMPEYDFDKVNFRRFEDWNKLGHADIQ